MLTTVTNSEVLAELGIIKREAIDKNDIPTLERLLETYRGLGFLSNASSLEKYLSYLNRGKNV